MKYCNAAFHFWNKKLFMFEVFSYEKTYFSAFQ